MSGWQVGCLLPCATHTKGSEWQCGAGLYTLASESLQPLLGTHRAKRHTKFSMTTDVCEAFGWELSTQVNSWHCGAMLYTLACEIIAASSYRKVPKMPRLLGIVWIC